MKTTFNQSHLDTAGAVRASRELRLTWLLLAIAVLVVTAPAASDAEPLPTCKARCHCKQQGYEASEEGRAQLLARTR